MPGIIDLHVHVAESDGMVQDPKRTFTRENVVHDLRLYASYGVTSVLSAKVRTFIVLVDVTGSHPNLMPDLSASLDVTLARTPNAIVIPRDSLKQDGNKTFVRVKRGDSYIEIIEGVEKGEEVVTSATFLIDAESNLKAALQAFVQPEASK